MQLSPLQSRLAASLIASFLVLILYLFLFAPQFAFAADTAQLSSGPAPLDSPIYDIDGADGLFDIPGPLYEPEFPLLDRSIIGRVADGAAPLDVDQPMKSNINPKSTLVYVFEAASVSGRSAQEPGRLHELRRSLNGTQDHVEGADDNDDGPRLDADLDRRQTPSRTLYISVNTCDQPARVSDQTIDPPQLILYVSTSSENTSPGPEKDQGAQSTVIFDEGAAVYNISLDHDVYFSISAPVVSDDQFDTQLPYNFEVAVSLDGYYHSYDTSDEPNLYLVDSDASSALLTTRNFTNPAPESISSFPYSVFVQNTQDVQINGLRKSYCGLSSWAQIRPLQNGNSQATVGLLQKGTANSTTQQFYVNGLNATANYTAIVALNTSLSIQKRQESGAAGGIVVYNPVPFSTKPNGACTFIFNLTLCNETQYAVPGNSVLFPNGTALAAFYENYTQTMWANFDKVLQQTQCEAPDTQRYSLVRDCDDCKVAYKNWLCSVAIPRCEDFSSTNPELQMRNINAPFPDGSLVDQKIRNDSGLLKAYNSSRNQNIDVNVQPGPYKEVLPCDYLCYELVQSCPASIGFSCPLKSSTYGYNTSYASFNASKELSCNFPGSGFFPPSGSAKAAPLGSLALLIWVPLLLML
ncbi:stretch-activated Ca2+-permeable channel component-domain-containing protein [Nemania sp. FL0916]|nr:stretch-activated Ca2+-permeable channel component-domain-containing protein [Nemania sp. FL0916]